MKGLGESIKIILLIAISLLVIGLLGCKEPVPTIEINGSIVERIIRIDAEGDILHYQETLFWNEKKFSEIWEGERRKEVLERIGQKGVEGCRKGCRLDVINSYLNRLKNPGAHDNFI